MITPLISQSDVEDIIGADRLRQLCSVDGGDADETRVERLIQQASDRAAGKLLKAFSAAQIVDLAAADTALRGAIVDLFCGLAVRGRPEFVGPDGHGVYSEVERMALVALEDIAKAKDRLIAEEEVGQNPLVGNRLTRAAPPRFTFAATRRCPKGPGGF